MRILHIIDNFNTGGAQKLLVTFGHDARRCGIETEIICLKPGAQTPVGRELESLGIPVRYFPAARLLDLQRFWRVAQYLRKNKPDLIQTHLLYANVVGGVAAFAAGIPVIATLHLTGSDAAHLNWRDWLEARVMKWINRRVIAVGYKTAETHQPRLGNKKIDVIPNGVRLPVPLPRVEIDRVRRALVGDEPRIIIISVGKLRPAKSFSDLIRAFAILHPRFPRAVLLLAGEGEERPLLETLTRTLELEDCVFLLGNREDVPDLLAASDLFVSSSVAEGMPLAVLEAMMAGLPIVATSIADLPIMLKENCGLLVPPGRPDLLAHAAAEFLADENKRRAFGHNAQDYAEQHYSSAAWIENLNRLYIEVLK